MFLYYIALFLGHFYYKILKIDFNVVIFLQMLIYKGLCDLTIGKKPTSLTMIDDCGNKWNCITVFRTRPYHHIKLGGGWKRMVQACRLEEVVMVKVGFAHAGMNDTIYCESLMSFLIKHNLILNLCSMFIQVKDRIMFLLLLSWMVRITSHGFIP